MDFAAGLDADGAGCDRTDAAAFRGAIFFTAVRFLVVARFLEAAREAFRTGAFRVAAGRRRRADFAAGRREPRARDADFLAFFAFLAAFRAVFRGAAAFLDIARLGLLAIRRSFQRSAGRV